MRNRTNTTTRAALEAAYTRAARDLFTARNDRARAEAAHNWTRAAEAAERMRAARAECDRIAAALTDRAADRVTLAALIRAALTR